MSLKKLFLTFEKVGEGGYSPCSVVPGYNRRELKKHGGGDPDPSIPLVSKQAKKNNNNNQSTAEKVSLSLHVRKLAFICRWSTFVHMTSQVICHWHWLCTSSESSACECSLEGEVYNY